MPANHCRGLRWRYKILLSAVEKLWKSIFFSDSGELEKALRTSCAHANFSTLPIAFRGVRVPSVACMKGLVVETDFQQLRVILGGVCCGASFMIIALMIAGFFTGV